MAQERRVPFVSNETLVEAVGLVISRTKEALKDAESKLDDNVLDPFSALFEMAIYNIPFDEWIKREKVRQVQKTMQNAIGDFHQKLIGGIDGWEDLGLGDAVDVRNQDMKIIAEVKNKHNTVTGQHLVRIYDELDNALVLPEYEGYQSYYVTMIPKKRDLVKNFTPSDNHTKHRRPANDKIKIISGWLFYDIATGQKDSLFVLYKALPKVMDEEFGLKSNAFTADKILKEIFERSYKA